MMRKTGIPISLPLALALVCSSCRTTQFPESRRDAVKKIVEQLVKTAEVRRDPQEMQVYLSDLRGTGKGKLDSIAAQAVAEDLQHYLLMEINTKLNILERGLTPPPSMSGGSVELSAWAKETGATHVLMGDYVVRNKDVCISLRLVDVKTRLIVSAAGGMVPGEADAHRPPRKVAPRYTSYRRR